MSQTYNDAVPASTRNALEDLTAIRNNFAALKSCFSGPSSPPNPVAGMWWYDTTANILKLRNEANNAWLNVYDFANGYAIGCSNTVLAGTGIAVSGSLRTGNVTVSATAVPYTAGARLLLQADGGDISDYTTYTTVETIQLDRGGALRISFKLTVSAAILGSGSASGTAYGRIYRYRGGTVTSVGTARSVSVTSTGELRSTSQTFSQDISGWQAGDRVLLRAYCVKTAGGENASITGDIATITLSAGNAYGLTVVE